MNIKPGDNSNPSQINLTQTSEPRDVSRTGASQPASVGGAQNTDSIALSNTSDLVQLALSAGVDARSARVQQLKELYENNQYYAEPLAVSRSLIDAHVSGA